MALISISEAIKLSGVSRGTFYRKYLNEGLISTTQDVTGKKQIDTSELLRVFGKLDMDKNIQPDTLDNTDFIQSGQSYTTKERTEPDHSVELELLKTKLVASEAQVKELQSDKEWLQSQVTNLTDSIKLLEAPKRAEPEPTQPDPMQEEIAELKESLRQLSTRKWWQLWK